MNPLISVITFEGQGSRLTEHRIGLTQLQRLFNNSGGSKPDPSERRLFIVESPWQDSNDISSSTYRLRSLLRQKFHIPEDVFHAQYWNRTIFHFNEIINCPKLPTTVTPKTRFSLEYFELWRVVNDKVFSHHMRDNTGTVECAATGREIQCHKWSESSEWLLVVPRKCSFWSSKRGNAWDAIILCDPPPRQVKILESILDIEIEAFEGGYHGFIPSDILGPTTEQPPHESLSTDLLYYFCTHADLLGEIKTPNMAATFLRKIVASHYCQLLGFVSHQTVTMRSSGWAVQRRTQQEIDDSHHVESAWSRFKCADYLDALSTVLDALGIPQGPDPYDVFDAGAEAPEPTGLTVPDTADWRSSTADFLYLHRDFRSRLADYVRMTSSLAALNGMIGGRISILEARTARSLTLVAMLFAPPACVASIFSIPTDVFRQDGPPFWWYWAATIPLTVLVFLVTYLVHERDVMKRIWRARRPKTQIGIEVDSEKGVIPGIGASKRLDARR